MADITSIKGGRKEPCLYCGRAEHATLLACPRIAMVHIDPDTACITGISFWEDFFDEEETSPPAA